MQDMIKRAKSAPKHIVLPEGRDPRIIQGALRAARDGVARVTLIREASELSAQLVEPKAGRDEINIIPARPDQAYIQAYCQAYCQARADENFSKEDAKAALLNPLNFANMMVRLGDADGCVSGTVNTTPDVVRAALHIIGAKDKLVSSFFIMIMPQDHIHLDEAVIFSDCGLVIDPDAAQLALIARSASQSGKALLGHEPKLAMLSFSTYESAAHTSVDKVKTATDLIRRNHPEIMVDGPLQFDAAILPDIAARKAPGSVINGRANVFIFPDLNAGNIAYKITERLGGAKAIGPILQGLNKPANDLSRGCGSTDVYNMIVVTVLQAQINQKELST